MNFRKKKTGSNHLYSFVSPISSVLLLILYQFIPVTCTPAFMTNSSNKYGDNDLVIRIHLIRHGETEGNAAGVVCGQIETPLNIQGIEQAKSASSFWGNKNKIQPRHNVCNEDEKYYWRTYCSDLERAQETAKLVLDDPSSNLILDKRLREVAKGVREGRSLKLSYDEAMIEFLNENMKALQNGDDQSKPIPLLETDTDVWDRVHSWMVDVVSDAIAEDLPSLILSNEDEVPIRREENSTISSSSAATATVTLSATKTKTKTSSPHRVIKNVLAVSHSGTIRLAIEHLVSDQLPDKILDKHGNLVSKPDTVRLNKSKWIGSNMFIPNTSVTVIDIIPDLSIFSSKRKNSKMLSTLEQQSYWKANLVKFACQAHVNEGKN